MQQLLEYIEKGWEENPETKLNVRKLKELLDEEQTQIIEAYRCGEYDGLMRSKRQHIDEWDYIKKNYE